MLSGAQTAAALLLCEAGPSAPASVAETPPVTTPAPPNRRSGPPQPAANPIGLAFAHCACPLHLPPPPTHMPLSLSLHLPPPPTHTPLSLFSPAGLGHPAPGGVPAPAEECHRLPPPAHPAGLRRPAEPGGIRRLVWTSLHACQASAHSTPQPQLPHKLALAPSPTQPNPTHTS